MGIIEIPGLKMREYQHQMDAAQFDLKLRVVENMERIFCSIEYSTKLFQRETILRYWENFMEIVLATVENEEIKLQDISISYELMDAESKASQQLDFAFNF